MLHKQFRFVVYQWNIYLVPSAPRGILPECKISSKHKTNYKNILSSVWLQFNVIFKIDVLLEDLRSDKDLFASGEELLVEQLLRVFFSVW